MRGEMRPRKGYGVRGAMALVNVLLLMALILPGIAVAAPSAAEPSGAGGEVRVLAADNQGVQLEFRAPAFDFAAPADAADRLESCTEVQARGLPLSEEVGRPRLPVKVVLLGVPADANLSLDVTGSARAVASGIVVCPAVAPVSDEQTDQAGTSMMATSPLDAGVYRVDALYPAVAARLTDLGFMRSQRVVRLEIFPFQYNPVAQSLVVTDRVQISVGFGQRPTSASGAVIAAEPDAFEAAFQRSLLNYEAARAWRVSPATAAGTALGAPAAGWTPPQPGYKITVKEAGLYQLTRSFLSGAGVPVAQLDPRTLKMYNGGKEIAIQVLGEDDAVFNDGDAVLFFGQGVSTRYTDANIYWLTYGGATGLRMATRTSSTEGALAPPFAQDVRKETNTVYDSDLPKLPGYDHWFGQQITAAGAGKTGSVSVTLETPQLASGALTARLKVLLGAVTAGTHRARLYVNPAVNTTPVWDGTWEDQTVFEISANFPQAYLVGSGSNTIKIEIVNEYPGRAADVIRLDWVEVQYKRNYVAENNRLLFAAGVSGPLRYEVTGFTGSDVGVYDVTDPSLVARVVGGTVAARKTFMPLLVRPGSVAAAPDREDLGLPREIGASAAAQNMLRFGDNQPTPRRYLALDPAQRLTPLAISLDAPSNLQNASLGADYIIITHADFAAAVAPLATLRTNQGKRVRVVDVQDIYDEFGGGLMSAEAIRDFLAYTFTSWTKPSPSSVLLVGDGTYDFRGYRSTAPTFIPPYLEMVDPDAGETATDNRFVSVTAGDILPDMDIGRLPANTAAEATAMVNKILSYESQPAAPWMKQVLFVADDLEGGGGNFYAFSDGIADGQVVYKGSEVKILPAAYTPNKVYLGQTCDLANPSSSVECRAQIIEKINAGMLMVSYIGHGVKTYWAAERLYDTIALVSLANVSKLPVMLPMTCNEGYFIDPAEASLSEQSLRLENSGAIASWSPTGFGLAPGHDYLERGLFLAVFHDGVSLGAGATAAKLYLIANAPAGSYLDLIDTFLLLGDPALRVH